MEGRRRDGKRDGSSGEYPTLRVSANEEELLVG